MFIRIGAPPLKNIPEITLRDGPRDSGKQSDVSIFVEPTQGKYTYICLRHNGSGTFFDGYFNRAAVSELRAALDEALRHA